MLPLCLLLQSLLQLLLQCICCGSPCFCLLLQNAAALRKTLLLAATAAAACRLAHELRGSDDAVATTTAALG